MYIVLYVQYVLLDISVNTYRCIILRTCPPSWMYKIYSYKYWAAMVVKKHGLYIC
jgi:hypothetical protein